MRGLHFPFEEITNLKQWKSLFKENLSYIEKQISACIIALNEERCIKRCIDSVVDIVDEVIVVDTGSIDKTVQIASSYNKSKVKVYNKKWANDFADSRNFAINKATKDWLFFIDADEYLDKKDKDKFRLIINLFNNFPSEYNLSLSPLIINHDDHAIIGVKRIFQKNSNIRFYGLVHEELRKNSITTKTKSNVVNNISINMKLHHDGYQKNILNEKQKAQRNICLLKKLIMIEPEKPRWKYFLARDGFIYGLLGFSEIEHLLNEVISICKNNHCYYDYIFLSQIVLLKLKFCQEKFDEVESIAKQLETIFPNNSDSVFFSMMSNIYKMKNSLFTMLKQVIEYRENNFQRQYGMLHSNGYHIDFLIGVLLFELGQYEQASKYFDFLKDKFVINQDYFKTIKEFLHSR